MTVHDNDTSMDPLPVNARIENEDLIHRTKTLMDLIKDTMPMQIEWLAIKAKMSKVYYDALVNIGFTEQQALEIVKELN